MTKRRRWLLVGLVVALGLGYLGYRIWVTPLAGTPRAAGEPAPAFALVSHTGETVSLERLTEAGPAIVVFYRGHW